MTITVEKINRIFNYPPAKHNNNNQQNHKNKKQTQIPILASSKRIAKDFQATPTQPQPLTTIMDQAHIAKDKTQ